MSVHIVNAKESDLEIIENELDAYNQKCKPITQEKMFIPFSYVIKDNDNLIGGISAYSSMYHIGYISTLWIDERYRGMGYGKKLLQKVEKDLQSYGCRIVRVETFTYQGPAFYKSMGYEVFGSLYYDNCDLHEYFLCKKLDTD